MRKSPRDRKELDRGAGVPHCKTEGNSRDALNLLRLNTKTGQAYFSWQCTNSWQLMVILIFYKKKTMFAKCFYALSY